MTQSFVISTDLDGTLIDHHDYSYAAAIPAIKRCQSLGIPIILNTSKTYAEVIALQKVLNINAPIVVENGSAIIASNLQAQSQQNKTFGASREEVLSFIQHIREQYPWQFEGFNDWSLEQIINYTGLDNEAALRASKKQFSEPFIWHDSNSAFKQFSMLAIEHGLTILKGGRFCHLQGDTDKAKPLVWLLQEYSELFPSMRTPPKLIALGDNDNDIAMLNAADIAVCVRSPVAQYPKLSDSNHVIKTQAFGPEGWAEAVNQILDQYI